MKLRIMVNLADIANEAGRTGGFDALSRRYGLDAGQTARIVEVLLPAFATAFRRLALNPVAFAEFAKVLAAGAQAMPFDVRGQGVGPASGAALVDQLFRSPDGVARIAGQAADLAGVGTQAMQQIMPAVAATLAGGMVQLTSAQGLAGMLREWSDALRSASDRLDPPKPQDPWSAWQAAAGQMMGLQPAPVRPPSAPEPFAVLDAWVGMVRQMGGSPGPASSLPDPAASNTLRSADDAPRRAADAGTARPEAPGGGSPAKDNPFEAVAQMFEMGRETQAQHIAAFQSVMDNVWGAPRRAGD